MKFLRTAKRQRLVRFAVFFALLMTGSLLFFREYNRVRSEQITSWKADVAADCGVVLTGGLNRVREGFDLLSRGQIKKLIIAGVNLNSQLREIMPLWPYYGNLDERNVVLERRSMTTYGNAVQTLPLVEAMQCRDVVVVTSQTHMYRAFRTFYANYPESIGLFRHAVVGARFEASFFDNSTEALKSLFYSLWAY